MPPSDDPKKIALYLPNLAGGGAERVTVYLAEGFAERGVQTDLVLAKATGPYLSQVSPKVNIVDLDVPRTLFSALRLANYLRTEQPTAIISALNHSNLVTLAADRLARYKGKTIVTLHNQFDVPRETAPSAKERVISLLMPLFYRHADEIVAVSNGVADDAAAVLDLKRESVKTIYNPVISEAVLAKANQTPDDEWLSTPNLPVVLAIGRFQEQKDFPNLLRAFRKVRDTLDCRLIILGEGEDRQQLEALVKELKLEASVKLPGFVDNPYAYLSKADVFVLSSRWEGLPTVLIEALALGKPIVSTDCKSGPDEILQGGQFGTLVPVGDSNALAQALISTLDAPTISFDPVIASEPFTYARSVDNYLNLAFGRT